MQKFVALAMMVGILLGFDLFALSASRSQQAIKDYGDFRLQEAAAESARRDRLPLTSEQSEILKNAPFAMSPLRRDIEDWKFGGFLLLGVFTCIMVWQVTLSLSPRVHQPGTFARASLLGSLLGALVVGVGLTCILGAIFIITEKDAARSYDRYEWEVRFLFGAIAGTVIGAILGPLLRPLFRRKLSR